ncbi:MAG: aryl-sulfate sulfotransferase [Saprospiraceae bacterium]|nr:aryl-sulfate sulfotransferase [Saprospiraceae bacterium]
MIKHLLCIFFIALSYSLFAQQNTVGLLSHDPSKAYDGYNLIYPHNQPNVYLLDNCGRIVHTWEDEADFRPGNMAYLMPDGRLIKTKRPAAVAGNPIWAGGGGATVEIRTWDNELLWEFTINNEEERLHHDIAITNEGNILMIVWEVKTADEAVQAGRDPENLPDGELWPDYILEIKPLDNNEYEIVWEWHVWDHLVQDFDATKDNFGIVEDHPELVDINYDTSNGADDWMHTNAIDYDPVNDMIMLSVPTFHELWIIDHTTSTEEAATSNGGLGGRGGDLLYRWGNPAAYKQGTEADQKLFYQHDTHWIDDYLNATHPNYRKIGIFNNRVGADISTINVIDPGFDMYDWGFSFDGNVFGPAEFTWTASHPNPQANWSTGLSSVQFLPNGNALVCVGRFGYTFELTPDNEIVWEYKTPLISGQAANQGDTLSINNNLTFRVSRIPTDFEAFDGKDLQPKGYIENNPDSSFCGLLSSLDDMPMKDLRIYPNPTNDMVVVEWDGGYKIILEVYDMLGNRVKQIQTTGGRHFMDLKDLQSGMYYIRINNGELQKLIIQR